MNSKTYEFLHAFNLDDLRFFVVIGRKNIKFLLFASAFSVDDCIFYFTQSREKIFK